MSYNGNFRSNRVYRINNIIHLGSDQFRGIVGCHKFFYRHDLYLRVYIPASLPEQFDSPATTTTSPAIFGIYLANHVIMKLIE